MADGHSLENRISTYIFLELQWHITQIWQQNVGLYMVWTETDKKTASDKKAVLLSNTLIFMWCDGG